MSALVLAEKTCTKCGETKQLGEFSPSRSNRDRRANLCKPCSVKRSKEWQNRRRAEMGEDAWKARNLAAVRASRARTGNARGKQYAGAQTKAIRHLIEAHRAEYDALLSRAKYEAGL